VSFFLSLELEWVELSFNYILFIYTVLVKFKVINTKKQYWKSDVKTAYDKERQMRKIWVLYGRPRGMESESYFSYKRANRDFRIIQQSTYDKCIQETYNGINYTAEFDIRLFWKMIKRQKPKQSKIYPEIIINENVSNTPGTRSNDFDNYFHDLYNHMKMKHLTNSRVTRSRQHSHILKSMLWRWLWRILTWWTSNWTRN